MNRTSLPPYEVYLRTEIERHCISMYRYIYLIAYTLTNEVKDKNKYKSHHSYLHVHRKYETMQ